MDPVMLASFVDEITKIAGTTAIKGTSSAFGKPASFSQAVTSKGALKPQTKMTDYTTVHTNVRPVVASTADASKAVPPPPVVA